MEVYYGNKSRRAREYIEEEPEVRFYTVQIANTVRCMRDRYIIHCDLKMGDIFLEKDMNVKLSNSDLAALLMSDKNVVPFNTIRRFLSSHREDAG